MVTPSSICASLTTRSIEITPLGTFHGNVRHAGQKRNQIFPLLVHGQSCFLIRDPVLPRVWMQGSRLSCSLLHGKKEMKIRMDQYRSALSFPLLALLPQYLLSLSVFRDEGQDLFVELLRNDLRACMTSSLQHRKPRPWYGQRELL